VRATRLPSNYSGVLSDTTSNENINVQNQEENQNAGEGCSRDFHVALDNDGYEINLNFPPQND